MNAPRKLGPRGRFWLVYAAAWLDLAGIYFVVFLISGEIPLLMAIQAALIDVLPMALFGIGVLRISRTLTWSPQARGRFFGLHIFLALIYGLASTATGLGLFALHRWVAEGVLRPYIVNAEIFAWESVMGMLVYGVVAGIAYALQLQARLREQEARAARAAVLQSQAELRALRAQVNPHFLFNTLHSLLALVRHDPDAAEEALEQFGDLLHYALRVQQDSRDEVPLDAELTFVRNYLSLERIRLGERLKLDIRIDDETRSHLVPVFCLQPLVENAVRHGIAPRAAGGTLSLTTEMRDGELILEVRDDGPGAPASVLSAENGLGLRLVRERLRALYGDAARFEVDTGVGRGFRATIRLGPARQAPTDEISTPPETEAS